MCHISCIVFGLENLSKEEVQGKRVLDVGSYDWNGNFYTFMKLMDPGEFIGTDMLAGPGVDVVCRAEDVASTFGKESFDIVVSSELMEHARNWREVISNIKLVCKPGGLIVITTRSKGFGLHDYPHDYWRYEIEDMQQIFADCEIKTLKKDNQAPGVFIKARKPVDFSEADLSGIALYSMIEQKRVKNIDPKIEKRFLKRCERREKILNAEKNFRLKLYHIAHKLMFRK